MEDFLSVMRTKYSSKYCSIRLNSFYYQKEKRSNDYCSRKKAFDLSIDEIVDSIYNYFSYKSTFILENYFPSFAVLKETSNYHFHFLILNHEYF